MDILALNVGSCVWRTLSVTYFINAINYRQSCVFKYELLMGSSWILLGISYLSYMDVHAKIFNLGEFITSSVRGRRALQLRSGALIGKTAAKLDARLRAWNGEMT